MSADQANVQKYNMLDDIAHVIECPDVYMGTLKNVSKNMFMYDPKVNNIQFQPVNYNTGLLKIFDEILTNATDNLQRQHSKMKNISVTITDDSISVKNDGLSIPIEQHESGIYIPEMVFTKFRSGSNFNQKFKTTGGKNGIGAKLTVVYSSLFSIHIVNKGKSYKQLVEQNCRKVHPPTITDSNQSDFIKITFIPDFKLLNCKLDDSNKAVLYKRVHDMTHLPINITLNDISLPNYTWDEFVNSYKIADRLFSFTANRWKVSFGVSDTKFRSVSFVNNICTYDGGEHVKYILDQLYKHMLDNYGLQVSRAQFKSKIVIFVSAIIDNPSFGSQAKEELQSPISEFGTTCNVPEQLIDLFANHTNILDLFAKPKPKQSTSKNQGKITSIDKLVEANLAGTAEGYKCTLFLCEGLSAKTMCDAGIGILGHDYYGCYPMRGKPLNSRNASDDKYDKNSELSDIKKIIGLEDGVEYDSVEGLRYGKVVCVKDADADGAAIMGLVINFFETKFPSLLKIEGFFSEFISPMIKVIIDHNTDNSRQNKRIVIPFYNEVEYKRFMENPPNQHFSVEFIKGLATNEDADIHEYFTHYDDNKLPIQFNGKYSAWLDMVYNSKRASDRKIWLTEITPDTHLPREKAKPISVIDFIRNDLVLFSYDDCVRSLPSLIDGLKPSQRKILYTLFTMSINQAQTKMKVFQLGGLVAKKANYHHGDQSMNSTIIGMAQDYPCSGNNIPLLKASGQFGSRVENGEDAGAPRYIACSLDKIARLIFPQIDDALCPEKYEDNQLVEPFYYVPIIPMILVNGARGIGTGWSTDIPSFNILEIITFVKARLTDSATLDIHSAYKGFVGSISETKLHWRYTGIAIPVKQRSRGNKIEILSSSETYHVTELPIRYSTSKFISRLNYLHALYTIANVKSAKIQKDKSESILANAKKQKVDFNPTIPVVSFINNSTVDKIDFIVTFNESINKETAEDCLGLVTTIKKSNMVAFDANNIIIKYDDIYQIINEWFRVRYSLYEQRIDLLIKQATDQMKLISNKCRFIKENIEGIIDVKNKTKSSILTTLTDRAYDAIDNSFDYLLSMKIYSLTKDKYEKLLAKQKEVTSLVEQYKNTFVEEIWLKELDELEKYINIVH